MNIGVGDPLSCVSTDGQRHFLNLSKELRLEPFPIGIEEECDEQNGKYEE